MALTVIFAILISGALVWVIFLRPSRQEITLADKCPSCGGKTAVVETRNVDKATGKSITSIFGVIAWSIFALLFIGFGIAMAVSIWSEGDSGVIRWTYGPVLAGLAFLSIGIGIGRIGVASVTEYVKADRIKTPVYRCNNCNVQWNQYSTGSLAPVQVTAQPAPSEMPIEVLPLAEQKTYEPDVKEVCWFCQKNKYADGKPHQVVVFKKQDGQRLEQTITVPRCSSCQAFHMQKHPLAKAASTVVVMVSMGLCILIGTVSSDRLGFWAWVIGTIIFIIGFIGAVVILITIDQRRAKAAGTREEATANRSHPQVVELVKQGWQLDSTKIGTTN